MRARKPWRTCALALLGLVGALHLSGHGGNGPREARVQDRAAATLLSRRFPAKARRPRRVRRGARIFAVVPSPAAEGRAGQSVSPRPSLPLRIQIRTTAPEEGRDRPCRHSSRQLWEAIRDELRRRRPDFKFHIWLEPLELAAVRGHDPLRTRARAHPHLGRRALPAAAAPRRVRRLRRARAVEVVGDDGSRRPGRAPRPDRAPPDGEARPTRRPAEPEVHLRAVRDRRGQPLRPRGRAGRGRAARPRPTTRSSSTARPASARRTCSTPSATTSSASAPASAFATRRSRSSRPSSSSAVRRKQHRRLQGALPRRRRRPDRRRPVPRRPRPRRARSSSTPSTRCSTPAASSCITSDRAPGGARRTSRTRLVERFGSGLVVELEPPELGACAWPSSPSAPGSTASRSAATCSPRSPSRVTSSVRALEGALIRVVAYASLRRRAAHAGARPPRTPPPGASTPRPRPATSTRSSRPPRRSSGSTAPPSWPATAGPRRPARHVAMYLARELTDHSLPEIGRECGGRNHATVIHAVNRRSTARCSDDPACAQPSTTCADSSAQPA